MRILIYGQRVAEKQLPYIQDLLLTIDEEEMECLVHTPYLEKLNAHVKVPARAKAFDGTDADFAANNIDFVISLGGDGTILSAVTMIKDRQLPVLGINMGRLGFLASIENTFASQAIQMLARGMYTIEERTMIYLETDEKIFAGQRFALNDFTLHKRDTSSMITIHTYINGDFLTSYWADGLIVSTPTGSTGYSLSCGGPIVFPNSGNFIITPVAPHNLNVRPIVISDTSVISFEIEGRSSNYLCTLDSRSEVVTSDHQLAVRKCDFKTRLVLLDNFSFLKTIHEKLTWGKDSRN
ncbi:MAG: NAD kinase [Saprospiraceae bacterium]|nr:NAD kinase [Saprospiraceae bacterium]